MRPRHKAEGASLGHTREQGLSFRRNLVMFQGRGVGRRRGPGSRPASLSLPRAPRPTWAPPGRCSPGAAWRPQLPAARPLQAGGAQRTSVLGSRGRGKTRPSPRGSCRGRGRACVWVTVGTGSGLGSVPAPSRAAGPLLPLGLGSGTPQSAGRRLCSFSAGRPLSRPPRPCKAELLVVRGVLCADLDAPARRTPGFLKGGVSGSAGGFLWEHHPLS